ARRCQSRIFIPVRKGQNSISRQHKPLNARVSRQGIDLSALGQKQTYALQKAMSALPPIATAKADIRKRSCLLYPQKRTCAVQTGMSAKGHKRTSSHSIASSARTHMLQQVNLFPIITCEQTQTYVGLRPL